MLADKAMCAGSKKSTHSGAGNRAFSLCRQARLLRFASTERQGLWFFKTCYRSHLPVA